MIRWAWATFRCFLHCLFHLHRKFAVTNEGKALPGLIACWECERAFLGSDEEAMLRIRGFRKISLSLSK